MTGVFYNKELAEQIDRHNSLNERAIRRGETAMLAARATAGGGSRKAPMGV